MRNLEGLSPLHTFGAVMNQTALNLISELEDRKRALLTEIKSIDAAIEGIRVVYGLADPSPLLPIQSHSDLLQEDAEFKRKYADVVNTITNRQICTYVIRKEGRFLHVREIADIAQKIKPHVEGVSYYRKALSPALTKLKSLEKIVSYRVGTNNFNTFWGKQEWLDDREFEGIKPAHSYNRGYLFENQKEPYE